jgi:hypothetical protein
VKISQLIQRIDAMWPFRRARCDCQRIRRLPRRAGQYEGGDLHRAWDALFGECRLNPSVLA